MLLLNTYFNTKNEVCIFCYFNNFFAIDYGFQVSKTKDATFISEILGDTLKVSQQNTWEIILNIKKGTVESWKVFSPPLLLLVSFTARRGLFRILFDYLVTVSFMVSLSSIMLNLLAFMFLVLPVSFAGFLVVILNLFHCHGFEYEISMYNPCAYCFVSSLYCKSFGFWQKRWRLGGNLSAPKITLWV